MRSGFHGVGQGLNNLKPIMAGWATALMIFKLVVLVVLIVVAIILIRKYFFSNRKAIAILNERYAKGEIEEEEYLKKKQILKK